MGAPSVSWVPPVVHFDLLTQMLGALPEIHASEAVDTCHVEAVMHSVQLLCELQEPCRSMAAYPNIFLFLHAGISSIVMNF